MTREAAAVGPRLARREDHDAGDRGDHERREVGEQVLEAPLDVHRAAVGARQHAGGREVHDDADESHDHHRTARGVRRRDQPGDPFVDDQQREDEQDGAVGLRGEDLRAAQAERQVPAGRAADQTDHHEAQDERAGVGQHVRRVRDQRQRACEDPGHDLDRHEAADQRERDPEAPRVAIPGSGVGMACVRVACVRMHFVHCPR